MATNGASYNPLGKETGPISDPPPPVSKETKSAINNAAQKGTGSHAQGQDTSDVSSGCTTTDPENK